MTVATQPPGDGDSTSSFNADETPPRPAGPEEAFRILIVEDDHSQALFAQGILQNAGMHTECAATAAEMIQAVATFSPDLVLMDLYLPDATGTDLTQALRKLPGHAQTPVVFLTGDVNPEAELIALDSGADDFLVKPIQPRRLVSAVLSRVTRARAAQQQAAGGMTNGRDPVTGLYRREQVSALMAKASGALLIELQGLATLRERTSYSGVETLLRNTGERLALASPGPVVRLDDNNFLALVEYGGGAMLETCARQLRDRIGQPIDFNGTPVRLRAAIAWMSLAEAPEGDPIDALERTLRVARLQQSGLSGYQRVTPTQERNEHTEALQAALREGRFELAYQPIVAVSGGDEAQFQVLLRMRDANGRLQTAADLVSSAEKAGLMAQVDQWVMAQAIALLQPGNGTVRRRISRLFVSQSLQAIVADPVGEGLLARLTESGIDPAALAIDLRLDDAVVHGLSLDDYCTPLAATGVRFCLSHYTASTDASLLLERLPLAYVRLAARYSRTETQAELRDELRKLIQDAHAANRLVIGSQVENPSAAATLWMSGIDYVQGNLIQRAGDRLDFDFDHSVL